MTPTHDSAVLAARAAAYVSTAADLLDAQDPREELFSPARVLAAQLALIAAGLSPDRPPNLLEPARPSGHSPVQHLDHALALLQDEVGKSSPDTLVWATRLRVCRSRLAALSGTTP